MLTCRSLGVGLLVVSCLAPSARAQGTADQRTEVIRLRAELQALEQRIDLARRTIPPEFDLELESRPARETSKVAELAVEIEPIGGGESVPLDGGIAPFRVYRLRFRGSGPLSSVQHWLSLMAIRTLRMRDLDVLKLEPASGAEMRFTADFVYPVWPPMNLPPPRSADPFAELRANVSRARATDNALSAYIARTADGRLVSAAALLDGFANTEHLRISRLNFAERLEMDGVVFGAIARGTLVESVRNASLGIERLAMPRRGACRPFSLLARPGIGDAPIDYTGPGGDTADLFGPSPSSPPRKVAAHGTGAISVHLTRVELADALFVLHEVTGESFVLDGDAGVSVDVNLDAVSLDEALDAFRSAGVFIGSGPLRRVSRTKHVAPAQKYGGEPISLALRDVALADVLCLLEPITGLRVNLAADARPQVVVFAREIPWDLAIEGLAASAGLAYVIDGDRLFVGPRSVIANPTKRPQTRACESPVPDDGGPPQPRLAAAQLDSTDVVLAGVAHGADGWHAYARLIWPPLMRMDAGTSLLDASVASVDRKGVSLKTRSGAVITLAVEP